eukprot:11208840-Lingulodinium_polyedra.AAC.1
MASTTARCWARSGAAAGSSGSTSGGGRRTTATGTPRSTAVYQEDLEFALFLCDMPIDSPVWERVEALRKQVPVAK